MDNEIDSERLEQLDELLEQEPTAADEKLAQECPEIRHLYEELQFVRQLADEVDVPSLPTAQRDRIRANLREHWRKSEKPTQIVPTVKDGKSPAGPATAAFSLTKDVFWPKRGRITLPAARAAL